MGLLDVDGVDILTWRVAGEIVAHAVIQTVADIGLLRTIRIAEDQCDGALNEQITDGVIAWCNRCQFRGVIAAMHDHDTIQPSLLVPLGLQPVSTYWTWHLWS
jgi:hypothetical protein